MGSVVAGLSFAFWNKWLEIMVSLPGPVSAESGLASWAGCCRLWVKVGSLHMAEPLSVFSVFCTHLSVKKAVV